MVIRLASGCPDTTREAVVATRCDAAFLKAAGELYVQHVLCFQGADPFRTLGVGPLAPREQMRLHMRQLMLCLHPDRSRNEWRTAAAARVLAAWGELSRKPHRPMDIAAAAKPLGPRGRDRGYKPPWVPRPVKSKRPAPRSAPSPLQRALRIAIVAGGLLIPNALVSEAPAVPVHDAQTIQDSGATPAFTLLSTAPPDEQAR